MQSSEEEKPQLVLLSLKLPHHVPASAGPAVNDVPAKATAAGTIDRMNVSSAETRRAPSLRARLYSSPAGRQSKRPAAWASMV
jgi:hypothetical protein